MYSSGPKPENVQVLTSKEDTLFRRYVDAGGRSPVRYVFGVAPCARVKARCNASTERNPL